MYEKVRSKMKTGDLIAFSGNGLVSNIIKKKTKSDISHVAMVLDTVESGEFRVEIIESTSLVLLPDSERGGYLKGVQRHKLSKVLKVYDGNVYWLPLKNALSEALQARMLSWLWLVWEKEIPYDTKQAIGSAIDFKYIKGLENEPDFKELFCSEMVAEAYKLADLLSECYNPSEATPDDVIKYPFLGDRVQIK